MVWTILFVVALMVAGCVLFSVHDWGRPRGTPGQHARMRRLMKRGELRIPPSVPSTARMGGVDIGKYAEFHSRHGGPATRCPPVPRE